MSGWKGAHAYGPVPGGLWRTAVWRRGSPGAAGEEAGCSVGALGEQCFREVGEDRPRPLVRGQALREEAVHPVRSQGRGLTGNLQDDRPGLPARARPLARP
ncbi:hypothetical protein Slala03_71440 [Streptomyces lavendulae subsp. lavendulae]|nr:hypothetical protein Slala03_71440 [Streptomyces lavendulae subsp. lavendulae]